MSRPQEPVPPCHLFSFRNPFRMISHKGSQLSPQLLSLLNTFEETLSERLRKLNPNDKGGVLSLSWMKSAMESLCETHTDIKTLITALELPLTDWDAEWIDVYLDISVKLLDLCIAFSSELTRINQGHLTLLFALQNLESKTSEQLLKAQSSLHSWRQHISLRSPRIGKCHPILETLVGCLDLPKVKKSAAGKVLTRAMYGVKVQSVLVCSIFTAAFAGYSRELIDLNIPSTMLWAQAFHNLQANLNGKIRDVYANGDLAVIRELDVVHLIVKKLSAMIQDGAGVNELDAFQNPTTNLRREEEKLSQGLDDLTREVNGFFKIVLTARDALLCDFRTSSTVSDSKLMIFYKVK